MFFYTFLPKLINMSLTASVAIAFVLLLRLPLRKAPKVISYALWGVVLFRLLCPVAISSGISMFNLFDAPTAQSGGISSTMEYVPVDIVHREYPEVTLPVPGVSEAINETLPQGEEQLRADPLEAPMAIATYVWMAGVLAMAVYSAVTYARLRRKLLTAMPLRGNIYLADEIASPFVMGLIRPRIYLPSSLEEREQDYIILHEQHHIHRLDHIIKALAFAALCVHWFNPLVWLAFILSGKDMEMSCDEAVIKKLGAGVRADYTASLLSLATGKRIIAGVPLAFGEGDTKGRIKNLANWKKPAFWVVLISVIACIALAVGLLTNPADGGEESRIEGAYYLRIGAEGVTYVEVSAPDTGGGCSNADGSPFEVGEEVYLEMLDGVTDLRGVSITALDGDGEILYALSIPQSATDGEIVNIVAGDGWLLAPAGMETGEAALPSEPATAAAADTVDTANWVFSPMMSAIWHAAFHFEFDITISYSRIEAACNGGQLWNLYDKGQARGDAMSFRADGPVCWTPLAGDELTETAPSAQISFTLYDGAAEMYTGVLEIERTGEEGGQTFYQARLTGCDGLRLLQAEGTGGRIVTAEAYAAMLTPDITVYEGADLDRDGAPEQILFRDSDISGLYELLVVKQDGTILWSEEVGIPHVGWTTILLYRENGKDYLIRHNPSMFQGAGNYTCTLFSLEGGQERVEGNWAVDFMQPTEVTEDMARFADEVNNLLIHCTLLVTTEQGELLLGPKPATEAPQIYPVRFDPDEVQRAMEYAVQQRSLGKAAEAFLALYFDDICDGDVNLSGLSLMPLEQARANGQLAHTGQNRGEMLMLCQWPDYVNMLSEFGYDAEREWGRFVEFDVNTGYAVDMLPMPMLPNEEYAVTGVCRTTAFSIPVRLGMAGLDNGNYAIVSVSFSEWDEYNSFCRDFVSYMDENGLDESHYGKSAYVDAKRKELQAAGTAFAPTITPETAAARYAEMEALFENQATWYDGNHRAAGDWDGDGKEDSAGFKDERRREFTVELSGSGTESIRCIDTAMGQDGFYTQDSPWGWEYYFDTGDLDGDGADELLFAIDTGAQGGAGGFCLLACPTNGEGIDALAQIETGLDYRVYWEGETDTVRLECEETGYVERIVDESLILPYMGTPEEAASRIAWMEERPDTPKSTSDDVSGFVITEDGRIVTRQYVTAPGGSHAEGYGMMLTEYAYGKDGKLGVTDAWFAHFPKG